MRGAAVAVAAVACLLLAHLGLMASLGRPVVCPRCWVSFVRRTLRLDRKQQAPPSIEATSYVAPLRTSQQLGC